MVIVAATQTATPTLQPVVLAQGQSGLLVAPTAAQVLQIAGDYLTNYAAFMADAQALVNPALIQAENATPEGTPIQLVVTGLSDPPLVGSQASNLANALNQAAAAGTLVNVDGTTIQPWAAGYPVAYADDATATLTVQWVKGQPWVWIVVGVALAVLGVVLYHLLTKSPYALTAFETSGGSAIAGIGSFVLHNWGWLLLGAAGVAAGAVVVPRAIRSVAEVRESENELHYAERGGY